MYPDIPAARVTVGTALQVALDETFLGVMRSPRRHPHRADYTRVGAELREALELYEANGWIGDPRAYHQVPAALVPIERVRAASRGVPYERVAWKSGFRPHPGEPGRERWQAHPGNQTAYAVLVRAEEPSAPWLICIHGFGMGMPLPDFHAFRAKRLATEIGCNLALPVLPMHGPRRESWLSGTEFMTFDLMHPLFGLSQAVYEIRALARWLQVDQGATRLGIYGVSLGAYTGSLLAGIDDCFDLIIAGIPASDLPRLFRHHSPAPLRRRALDYGMLGEVPNQVHRVVSPLAVEPFVPIDRRFVYAALGDRMSTAVQAHQLWNHWRRPRIEWLPGGHVGTIMSSTVDRFVTEALVGSGFTSLPPAPVSLAS